MGEGVIRISGKDYHVNMNDRGERFVNGMSIDAFMSTLEFDQLLELAMLGKKIKDKELKSGCVQTTLDAIQSLKNEN